MISQELATISGAHLTGLDIDHSSLKFAAAFSPRTEFIAADAHQIPFPRDTFSCSTCHFLLLWVSNPFKVISEMKRVTRIGGTILFLAEPDYGGRIDYPSEFSRLGEWQADALKAQGADPLLGRKLSAFLYDSGLTDIQVGVIGAQWKKTISEEQISSEWEVIRSDLESLKDRAEAFETTERLFKADLKAWKSGQRILYVPTFYGFGRVAD